MEIIVEEFIKSEKLLQILIKLLNPQILFCKSQRNLQIQELSLNPEKYCKSEKNILSRVTCASSRQRFAASKMAEFGAHVDQAIVSWPK